MKHKFAYKNQSISFFGISILGPYYYPEHSSEFYIGVLSHGEVPDGEIDIAQEVEWAGTLEETAETIAAIFTANFPNKGLLVYGKMLSPEVVYARAASVITGEVKRDADVKQEMYSMIRENSELLAKIIEKVSDYDTPITVDYVMSVLRSGIPDDGVPFN